MLKYSFFESNLNKFDSIHLYFLNFWKFCGFLKIKKVFCDVFSNNKTESYFKEGCYGVTAGIFDGTEIP